MSRTTRLPPRWSCHSPASEMTLRGVEAGLEVGSKWALCEVDMGFILWFTWFSLVFLSVEYGFKGRSWSSDMGWIGYGHAVIYPTPVIHPTHDGNDYNEIQWVYRPLRKVIDDHLSIWVCNSTVQLYWLCKANLRIGIENGMVAD